MTPNCSQIKSSYFYVFKEIIQHLRNRLNGFIHTREVIYHLTILNTNFYISHGFQLIPTG
jgi:hypothetical protein